MLVPQLCPPDFHSDQNIFWSYGPLLHIEHRRKSSYSISSQTNWRIFTKQLQNYLLVQAVKRALLFLLFPTFLFSQAVQRSYFFLLFPTFLKFFLLFPTFQKMFLLFLLFCFSRPFWENISNIFDSASHFFLARYARAQSHFIKVYFATVWFVLMFKYQFSLTSFIFHLSFYVKYLQIIMKSMEFMPFLYIKLSIIPTFH